MFLVEVLLFLLRKVGSKLCNEPFFVWESDHELNFVDLAVKGLEIRVVFGTEFLDNVSQNVYLVKWIIFVESGLKKCAIN